jgi:hypothetical protein
MAKFYDVNTAPATGAVAMYNLKTVLLAVGWTVTYSSDGVSTATPWTGNNISHGGSGNGGFANNKAYCVLRDPGTPGREICIQRTTTNYTWRIKYSVAAHFSTGASQTQVPSATDEGVVVGSGTDAAPIGIGIFPSVDGSYKHHIIAQSTAESGAYGFWYFTNSTGISTITAYGFLEPLDSTASSASDQDRCVLGFYNNSPGVTYFSRDYVKAWYKLGLGGAQWTGTGASGSQSYYGASVGTMGVNPYDGNENGFQILWGRNNSDGAPTGPKGIGKYLRWKCSSKVFPDSLDLATDAYVFVGDVLFPWPESVTPVA